jgi:hypothetical protein
VSPSRIKPNKTEFIIDDEDEVTGTVSSAPINPEQQGENTNDFRVVSSFPVGENLSQLSEGETPSDVNVSKSTGKKNKANKIASKLESIRKK